MPCFDHGQDSRDRFDLGSSCGSRTMDVQAGPSFPYKPAQSQCPSPRIHKQVSLTSDDMRSFSIHGPYGINISLATAIPGRFSLAFPQNNNNDSKPMSSSAAAPEILATTEAPMQHYTVDVPVDNITIRAPSPTPTEVDDPEPESILEKLKSLGIKVRDFAYPSSSKSKGKSRALSPSIFSPPEVISHSHTFTPATEIFDQYRGIAEFEYRLAQSPRTVPISGRTLRRLLDIGWIPMSEAKARLHQMDWEAMKDFDAQSAEYPWRPCKWSSIPDEKERARLLGERGGYFYSVDRLRKHQEALAVREEYEKALVEEAQERMRIREAEREGGMGMVVDPADDDDDDELDFFEVDESIEDGPLPPTLNVKKRSLEHTLSTPMCSTSAATSTGPKRARLSGEILPEQVQTITQLSMPPKQYPAPASSYDPVLYPDAARVIAAEVRPPPPPRSDTPPADDEVPRPRKGLTRKLSRSQTIMQL